jgi:pyruvate dehydrogenase E1 component alpha subunit
VVQGRRGPPEWRTADPVENYRDELLDDGVLTEAEYEELTDEIDANLEEAVAFGRDSPYPDPDAAYEGLYAEEI